MAFEIENNLLNNPDYLARFLWQNNPEEILQNLADYGMGAGNYADLLAALQAMYDTYGVEGVQLILNVRIIPENLTAGEAQALENVMQTIGDPGIYQQRGGVFGDPQIDPDQFINDYPSSPGGDDTANESGGGAHWTEVTGNILEFGSSILDAFFSGNSTQTAPTPGQSPTPPPSKPPSWPLIAGGVLLAIAVIVVIVQLTRKKK